MKLSIFPRNTPQWLKEFFYGLILTVICLALWFFILFFFSLKLALEL